MENKQLNVYSKLAKARVKLQGTKMNKSGKNTYSNYTYFEMSDFLPHINKIQEELGLISIIAFDKEIATLQIINTEKPEEVISFTCEVKGATLKGCHEIQNYGAVQTYTRRYLYMLAYEIVEHDALDSITGSEKGEPQPSSNNQNQGNTYTYKLSQAQINRFYGIATNSGYSRDDANKACYNAYKKKVEDLNRQEYDDIIKAFEANPRRK